MNHWTKLTEATPEPKTYVFVASFDKEVGVNVTRPAYWDGERFRHLRDFRPLEEPVTRWKPYPETPEPDAVESMFRRPLKGV